MIINSIDTKDISFVVQGAIDKVTTKLCLESIRRNFPGSTIILSTWENSNVKGLDYDKVIFSNDPGGAVFDTYGHCFNINRQFVSSYNGLRVVTTKYSAKVRNDLIFDGPDFLNYFGKFPLYDSKFCKVKSRMIVLTLYTRFASSNISNFKLQNYNVSDWFCFGYSEDVMKLYSVAPVSDLNSFTSNYLDFNERNKLVYSSTFFKNTPEQYLGSWLRGLDYENETIESLSNEELKEDSERFMVNNFIILDYQYSKIHSEKWKSISQNEFYNSEVAIGLYFFSDFLHLYQKYCDKNFIIPDNIDKQIRKRKLNAAKDFLWRNKIREYRHKIFEKIKHRFSFVKKIIRCIFPAYRVGYGTRDILLRFQAEQRDNLNFLHYKIDNLSSEIEKKSEEIKKLNKQLSNLKEMNDDKSK